MNKQHNVHAYRGIKQDMIFNKQFYHDVKEKFRSRHPLMAFGSFDTIVETGKV